MSYSYNELARQVSTTYGGAVTTVTSDYLGRKVAMSDADMGAWSYTYDALNLTSQTDARGCATGLNYDLLNRLTGKSYTNCPGTNPAVSYTYDGILRSDVFDGASLPSGWAKTGTAGVSNGALYVTGDGDANWDDSAYRSGSITDGQAVRFRFKLSQTNAVAGLYLRNGSWGTVDYRRWGISITTGTIRRIYYKGTSSNQKTLLTQEANTWYQVTLVADGYDQFRLVIFKESDPSVRAESSINFDPDSDWAGRSWSFIIQAHTGAVYVDDYQEFDAGAAGQRSGMSDGSGSTSWAYDQRGRLGRESKVITGSGTFLTQWGYNSGDMLSWIKYPLDNLGGSGEQVNYSYLPQGALLQVTNATKYALNMQYDAAGRLTSITRGDNILNTAYAYYPWDIQGGRLKTIKTGTGAPVTPTLQSFEYDYDPNGNIDWIKDYLAAGGTQTQTFHYDELNRLKDAQASGGTAGTYAQQVYNYDSSTGNLSSKAGVSYTYNAQVSCAAGSRTIPHADPAI